MASALNRLSTTALRGTFRVRPRQTYVPRPNFWLPYHTSQPFREDRPPHPASASSEPSKPSTTEPTTSDAQTEKDPALLTAFDPSENDIIGGYNAEEEIGAREIATRDEEAKFQELLDNPPRQHRDAVAKYKSRLESVEREFVRKTDLDGYIRDVPLPPSAPGFLSMGMEDIEEDYEDETFEGDDITSTAHGELDQHREIREYARITAWEMPMLSKFAKPFVPPTSDTPLRFRYTSYMGEEHPAQNKVVVEFCTADLPITPAQRLKLVKLVGPRYDPQSDIVKASCEMFETQAQNKRYLGDLVDSLVMAAKGEGDTEAAKDSFEDVPVDFRHVRWKPKIEFPEGWKLTPERKAQLEADRAARAQREKERIEAGKLVDGLQVIEAAIRSPSPSTGKSIPGALKAKTAVKSKAGKKKSLGFR